MAPRAVLIKIAVGFICLNASRLNRPLVSGLSTEWTDKTSLLAKRVSKLTQEALRSFGADGSGCLRHPIRCKPDGNLKTGGCFYINIVIPHGKLGNDLKVMASLKECLGDHITQGAQQGGGCRLFSSRC